MKMLFANLLPIVCVLCGVYLISIGKDGWGWLFFLAFLAAHDFEGWFNDADK